MWIYYAVDVNDSLLKIKVVILVSLSTLSLQKHPLTSALFFGFHIAELIRNLS